MNLASIQLGATEAPEKSGFDQVHVASTASEPNLAKTPFAGTTLVLWSERILRGRTVTKIRSSLHCLSLLVLGIMTGCNPCKEEIWNTATSPDGKWTATIIMRDCGSTTSETVSVNVYQTGSKGFQADHNALVMKHGQAPRLFWSENDSLLLDCHDCNSKDEIARAAQIGPIHIELRMP